MSVPLSQLLADSTEKVRNSTTGALDNNKRTRAANRVLQDLQDYADWIFTRRTIEFDYIDGVSEYSLENYLGATCLDNDGATSVLDFKSPYDLRVPGVSHNPFDNQEVKEVRANLRDYKSLNQYGAENGILVINYARQSSMVISPMTSLTDDGIWSASGNASNLIIDNQDKFNFDFAGTSGAISNTTLNALNLETLENKSHFVIDVDLPTITDFTSITLRWGNDLTANYWEKTETVPAGNIDLKVGINKFAFKWADSTITGAPDSSSIDSFSVTLTYGSSTTDTDFRMSNLKVGEAIPMELEYYSLAMVKNASGAYQLEFNADSVTQTDVLLGDSTARRCIVQGMTYELFEIIGGKSERDRTDSYKIYGVKKLELLKKTGVRIKRAPITLKFPSRRGRF